MHPRGRIIITLALSRIGAPAYYWRLHILHRNSLRPPGATAAR